MGVNYPMHNRRHSGLSTNVSVSALLSFNGEKKRGKGHIHRDTANEQSMPNMDHLLTKSTHYESLTRQCEVASTLGSKPLKKG